jgi:D-glycero-D-manno-heptose 1,7-bisphosphate phosphatase
MLRILFTRPKCVGEAIAGDAASLATDLSPMTEAGVAPKVQAIFIDRDGVINCRRPDDYVLEWSQFIFVPGMRAALKQLASLGLPMIVISNQAAVGKGLLDAARLEEITRQMQQALLSDGTPLAAAYYCIHRSDENCPCRKPKPGLLVRAAADFHIDLRRSIFIGDSDTDAQAAHAAGCRPVLFSPRRKGAASALETPQEVSQALTASDLFAVAKTRLQAQM